MRPCYATPAISFLRSSSQLSCACNAMHLWYATPAISFVLTFLRPVRLTCFRNAMLVLAMLRISVTLHPTISFLRSCNQLSCARNAMRSYLRQSYRTGQSSCGTGGVLGWSLRRASYSLDKTSCTIPRRMSSCSGISPRSFVSAIQRSRAARIRCKIS
jgi:hypothetical protein